MSSHLTWMLTIEFESCVGITNSSQKFWLTFTPEFCWSASNIHNREPVILSPHVFPFLMSLFFPFPPFLLNPHPHKPLSSPILCLLLSISLLSVLGFPFMVYSYSFSLPLFLLLILFLLIFPSLCTHLPSQVLDRPFACSYVAHFLQLKRGRVKL